MSGGKMEDTHLSRPLGIVCLFFSSLASKFLSIQAISMINFNFCVSASRQIHFYAVSQAQNFLLPIASLCLSQFLLNPFLQPLLQRVSWILIALRYLVTLLCSQENISLYFFFPLHLLRFLSIVICFEEGNIVLIMFGSYLNQ